MIGHSTLRLPNHISFILNDKFNNPIAGRELVRFISRRGISLSSGTACSQGKTEDSHVLQAIGIPQKFQQSGVRISLGNWILENDIKHITSILKSTLKEITGY